MDLFKPDFEEELYREISQSEIAELDKGSVILKEGAYISRIPLVLEGAIKVRKADESGKEILLYHINPGESCILSITSCLIDKQSKAEALTETKTKLIVVTSDQVRSWMDRYKSWRDFVTRLYYLRLEELLSLVDDIAFKQVDYRLIENLKEKLAPGSDEITATHQQIANELGTAREVVSRLLKQLEKEGRIQIHRGKIKVLSGL